MGILKNTFYTGLIFSALNFGRLYSQDNDSKTESVVQKTEVDEKGTAKEAQLKVLTVGQGLENVIDNSFNEFEKDVKNYMAIEEAISYIDSGVVDLKNAKDNDPALIREGLKKLYDAYIQTEEDGIISNALNVKLNMSLDLLQKLYTRSDGFKTSAKKDSTGYSSTLEDSNKVGVSLAELLPDTAQREIKTDKALFNYKITELKTLLDSTTVVGKLGRYHVSKKLLGFSKIDSLIYGNNDDLSEIAIILEKKYEKNKSYLEGINKELFNDWFNESYLPLLNNLGDIYSEVLNRFPKNVKSLERYIENHVPEDKEKSPVPDLVKKRKEELEDLISRIESLKYRKVKGVKEKAEEEAVEDTKKFYDRGIFTGSRITTYPISGKHVASVGSQYSDDMFLPGVGLGYIFDEDRGLEAGLKINYCKKNVDLPLTEVTTEKSPFTGNYGYSTTEVSREFEFLEPTIYFSKNLTRGHRISFGVDVGAVIEKMYEEGRTVEQLKNDEKGILDQDVKELADKTTTYKSKFGVNLGYRPTNRIRIQTEAGLRGEKPFYGVSGSVYF